MKVKLRVAEGLWELEAGHLRDVRERSGISLSDLAREMGVDPSVLSNVELGRRRSYPMAIRYMEKFGLREGDPGSLERLPINRYVWALP